jgi:hypothetical protein
MLKLREKGLQQQHSHQQVFHFKLKLMKTYFYITFLLLLFSCKVNKKESLNANKIDFIPSSINNNLKKGYLFIDISKIYYHNKKLEINSVEKEVSFFFNGKKLNLNNKSYDIIEDFGKYSDLVKCEAFFPEYDLFIVECLKKNDGYYITINTKQFFIDNDKYNDLLTFKTQEEYILDVYPIPSIENSLREEPNINSKIISDYNEFTFISIEIDGDWLKIKDDKECYSGENPSKKDIIGWVKWRDQGKIIINIAHIC